MIYYKRDGTVCTAETWAKDFDKNRIVRQKLLKNGIIVSTVFLGINHSFCGLPLIFETMIFDRTRTELDIGRYATEQEAIKGHNKYVRKWKKIFTKKGGEK